MEKYFSDRSFRIGQFSSAVSPVVDGSIVGGVVGRRGARGAVSPVVDGNIVG